MVRTGIETKERILDAAEELVMDLGFGGTSIDKVIGKAGITKGAFFYHFDSKNELAFELVSRFARLDKATTYDVIARAEKIAHDPFQRLLVSIGLFAEMFEDGDAPRRGCLLATFCYESALIDERTSVIVAEALKESRLALRGLLNAVVQTRQPKVAVDLDVLADMFTAVLEGAFVLERSFQERGLIANQIRQYGNYLELLFAP